VIKKLEQLHPCTISFIQALGLTLYISLVSVIFWKGDEWFGTMHRFLGPMLVLILLVVSALICAIIALGYPVHLFWEKKQRKLAIKIVTSTALWLVGFFLSILVIILLT